ncbi:MAG TPA: hypothetical protein DIU39_01710 [Flavobacteriales bacterium]|nr:hypothetical protein [Flavobacteriales bacterium]
MKRTNMKNIALAVTAASVIVACNPLNKMVKRQNEVNYEATPNPLEMHGDSIEVTVKGSFPTKYFNKKVSATVTPVLKYGENEEAFKPFGLKGEDSEAEGTTIPYEAGGSFSYTAKIPYKDGMDVAELELRVTGKYKEKTKDLDPVKAADGTIITPKLVRSEDKTILGADKFVKFVMVDNKAVINFLVKSAVVRPSELSDEDIKALKEKIAEYVNNPKMEFISLNIDGYASPEGEIELNTNLAEDRAKAAGKVVERFLKKYKVEAANNEGFYKYQGKGEDWEGFKAKMNTSNIADKDMIIRILESYPKGYRRQLEIQNLAATYKEVAEKILPELRRAEINLVTKLHSKTDEEINALIDSNPDSLTVEELLYGATLTNDLGRKLTIYKHVIRLYPNDWRGPNNVGYVYLLQNKVSEAQAEFEKADKLSPNNPVVQNNLGVCARLQGDIAKAEEYYKAANGAGPEVNENLGIVYIIKGDYASAVSAYSNSKGFNAALANLLNGNIDIAAIIDNSDDKDDADAYYLKAIAGARSGNTDMLINNLKSAIAKDASFKEKAKRDAEFIKFRDNTEFQAAVN